MNFVLEKIDDDRHELSFTEDKRAVLSIRRVSEQIMQQG